MSKFFDAVIVNKVGRKSLQLPTPTRRAVDNTTVESIAYEKLGLNQGVEYEIRLTTTVRYTVNEAISPEQRSDVLREALLRLKRDIYYDLIPHILDLDFALSSYDIKAASDVLTKLREEIML